MPHSSPPVEDRPNHVVTPAREVPDDNRPTTQEENVDASVAITTLPETAQKSTFVSRFVVKIADLLHDGTPGAEGEWDDDVSGEEDDGLPTAHLFAGLAKRGL